MKSFLSILSVSSVAFIFILLSGCSPAPTWKAVPVENLTPLYNQEFAGSGAEVIIKMYAKDIFYITIRNTLEGYRLKEIPALTSHTGDIVFPSSKESNEIAFNFSPKSKTAIERETQDILIPWNLEETGDKGFLITRKSIVFDFTGAPGNYHINSIRITAVADVN
jgi:hypothetical protein